MTHSFPSQEFSEVITAAPLTVLCSSHTHFFAFFLQCWCDHEAAQAGAPEEREGWEVGVRGIRGGGRFWQGISSIRKEESAGNEAHPACGGYRENSSHSRFEGSSAFFHLLATSTIVGFMD